MRRLAPEALAYQSPLERIRHEPLPWLLRLWPFGAGALLAALVGLAALLPIDVVVSAGGRIAADDPAAVLRPVTAAVLRSLLVRPGDLVAPGQLLARLDSRTSDADAAQLKAQAAALSARIARIEAELAGRPLEGAGPDRALEGRIQSGRAATETALRHGLEADLARIDRGIEAARAERPALAETLATARELEAMRERLMTTQNGTRAAFVETRLARLEAEARQRRNEAALDGLLQERAGAAARLAAFESDRRQKLLEELADLRPRRAVLAEQIAETADLARLHELRAPGAGVVLSVAAGGPGSLMTPADPVAVIAPTGGGLHAELGLLSRDAGLVRAGAPVRVKVDAFPWRHHGAIEGRLADVAPSSAVPPGGGPAQHAARVVFPPGPPPPEGLMPGMTLTADILAGRRTLLSYFLDPLLEGLSESLREPRP